MSETSINPDASSHQAAAKEVFRIRNIHWGDDKYFVVSDHIFAEQGVYSVCRAACENLWKLFAKQFPLSAAVMFGPLGFLLAVLGGAIASLTTGDKDAFDVGGVVGLVVSIPLSIMAINRLNRRGRAKAVARLEAMKDVDAPITNKKRQMLCSRSDIADVVYEPGENLLVLQCTKNRRISLFLPYADWEKYREQVMKYLIPR